MKKSLILVPLIFLIAGFTINTIIDGKIRDILKQIQMDESSAKNYMFSNFSGPSFYVPNIKNLKSIASGDRKTYVKVIGDFAKQYVSSKEFTAKYNEYRESRKPTPPEKPKTAAEMKQEYKDNLKKSIEESEKTISSIPKESRDFLEESVKQMKEQLKQIDDPNNTMFSPDMDKIMQDSYKQQMEAYNQEIKKWETEYPAGNPNNMIKEWLNNFLKTTEGIDFGAKVAIDTDGRSKFVKQEYERKNNTWKLCYRAGRETVELARNFAQDWLKQLK